MIARVTKEKNKPIWLNHNLYPQKDLSYINQRKPIHTCDSSEDSSIKNWQPQHKKLISFQGLSRQLPPIYNTKIGSVIIRNLTRKYKLIGIAYLPVALFFLFSYFYWDFNIDALIWTLLFSTLSMLHFIELKFFLSTVKGLKERAFFFNWLYTSSHVKKSFIICLTFASLIGLSQTYFYFSIGNQELFNEVGVMYHKLSSGEYWRLFTGPLLHYSFSHYIINSLTLVIIGTLCYSLIGNSSILVFFIGNALGAYLQYFIGPHELDNCGGISFGNYALLGWLISYNILINHIFPKGFNITLILLTIINLLSSEVISDTTASIGHITGLVFGVTVPIFINLYYRVIKPLNSQQILKTFWLIVLLSELVLLIINSLLIYNGKTNIATLTIWAGVLLLLMMTIDWVIPTKRHSDENKGSS